MRAMPFPELAAMVDEPSNGWSIGTFGAIGEFARGPDEAAFVRRARGKIEVLTGKGAMRLVRIPLRCIAWEGLSSDGAGWNHNLALCVQSNGVGRRGVTPLGRDAGAVRPEDRGDWLFDVGVARGAVSMCVRTGDAALKAVLDRAAGRDFLELPAVVAAVVHAQPNRVMLSRAGRIEVFQPIPDAHDRSPEGPHTHLLARLVASERLHGANDPIPPGWQAAINLHPARPWVGERGRRRLDLAIERVFGTLLARYGDDREADLERRLVARVVAGADPRSFVWPADRRGRTKARIVLRRLSADGNRCASEWRRVYDRCRSPAVP